MANYQGVSVDIQGLAEIQRLLNPATFQKAVAAGITYAARSTPASVAKEVSSFYNIPSRRVKQDTRGPFLRGSGGDRSAELFFSRRPPTAMRYGARQTPSGLSMQIMRGGGRTTVPGGFIRRGLPFRSAPGTVYRADVDVRRRPRPGLRVIYGPSIGAVFVGNSAHGEEIRRVVGERINEQFMKGVERSLSAAVRGFGSAAS